MKWNLVRPLRLLWLLTLPVICLGQETAGSRTDSNPLNVYAPPCVSQVKQHLAVSCQITPTGGAQPYIYAFTGKFPEGMSMSSGMGGGLINGTPSETMSAQATVTVTDARGTTGTTSFTITPASLTGTGPCGSAICVTAPVYAIKTPESYVITPSSPLQMVATGFWSDSTTYDLTRMASWACDPSPACGSVSPSGLYTVGSSASTYRVTATFTGVTNDNGAGAAVTAAASPPSSKEHNRVANSGVVLKEVLQLKSGIPASLLEKAECVVIIPSTLKFAIGIGGSYGRGVMTCRGGSEFRGPWGTPTMMALGGGSAGLQLGGQATDFVLLLMSPRSAQNMLKSKVKLGGDVSAAAGPVGRSASAETDVTLRAEILSYSRSRGLFGGISLSGSTLRADNGANKNLYGKEIPAQDIVFKNTVPVPDSAKELLATLQKASPKNKGK